MGHKESDTTELHSHLASSGLTFTSYAAEFCSWHTMKSKGNVKGQNIWNSFKNQGQFSMCLIHRVYYHTWHKWFSQYIAGPWTIRVWTLGVQLYMVFFFFLKGFPHSSVIKESACNAGDLGSIPGMGRSPGEGNGSPLQYSCRENLIDRGAWQATIHGVSRVRYNLVTKSPPPMG